MTAASTGRPVHALATALCAAMTTGEAVGAASAAVRARLGTPDVWIALRDGRAVAGDDRVYARLSTAPDLEGLGPGPLWLDRAHLRARLPEVADRLAGELGAGTGVVVLPLGTPAGEPGVGLLVAAADGPPDADTAGFLVRVAELTGAAIRRTVAQSDEHEAVRAAAARAERVGALAAALAAAMTVVDVADVLAEHVQQALGSDTFSLRQVLPEEKVARAVRLVGAPIGYQDRYGDIRLDLPSATAEVAATKTAVFVRSAHDNRDRYGDEATVNQYEAARIEGLARLPLTVEGELIGILSVGYWRRQQFTHAERLFLTTVADLAAQAMGRAVRTERLRQLQALSDLALSRLPIRELVTDLERRLGEVLRASRVAVYLYDPERLAFASGRGGDPEEVPAARQQLLGRAAASGRRIVAESPAPVAAVPLLAERDQVIGALVVERPYGAEFGPADLDLLDLVATRVAIAVDRSQVYELQRTLAQTLQAALLPPSLPAIPGARLAARYHAAGAGAQVGGDFYDVFAQGPDAWFAVMGDVRGRGPAAAVVTGLIRHTLRAVAVEEHSPAAILRRLNLVLHAHTGAEDFATVACARLEPVGSTLRVTIASAGHCSPLVLRAPTAGGRTVEVLDLSGDLLGAFEAVDIDEEVHSLASGDVLLLHTDGITEAPGEPGRYGEERLVAILRRLGSREPQDVVDAVHAGVLAHCGGQATDDLALLAIAAAPLDGAGGDILLDESLPYGPQSAADARRLVGGLAASVPDLGLLDDLRLAVSELVTNAFRHGSGGTIRLRVLGLDGGGLRLEVDSAGGVPATGRAEVDPLAEGGRGLLIVAAMADRSGLGRHGDLTRAWCEWPAPEI